jgi:hypothetical protein
VPKDGVCDLGDIGAVGSGARRGFATRLSWLRAHEVTWLPIGYQTRHIFPGFIGVPAAQWNAPANSA